MAKRKKGEEYNGGNSNSRVFLSNITGCGSQSLSSTGPPPTINLLASEQRATESPRLINPFHKSMQIAGERDRNRRSSHSQADSLRAIFLERCARRIYTILSHRSSRIFPVAPLLHLSLASVAESERDRSIVHEK